MNERRWELSETRTSTSLSSIGPASFFGSSSTCVVESPTSILTSLSQMRFCCAASPPSCTNPSLLTKSFCCDAASSAIRQSWHIGSRKVLWTVRLTEQLRVGDRRCTSSRCSSSESVGDGEGGSFTGDELACSRVEEFLSACRGRVDSWPCASRFASDSKHLT
jgi:hypothetical protein